MIVRFFGKLIVNLVNLAALNGLGDFLVEFTDLSSNLLLLWGADLRHYLQTLAVESN